MWTEINAGIKGDLKMAHEAKYTPGPWEADSYKLNPHDITQHRVKTVNHSDEGPIAAICFTRPDEECKANAHLIAAAPALLMACQAVLHEKVALNRTSLSYVNTFLPFFHLKYIF